METSAVIWTGKLRLMEVPSPNWPSLFQPMAHNEPSVLMNAVWYHPAETMDTSVAT